MEACTTMISTTSPQLLLSPSCIQPLRVQAAQALALSPPKVSFLHLLSSGSRQPSFLASGTRCNPPGRFLRTQSVRVAETIVSDATVTKARPQLAENHQNEFKTPPVQLGSPLSFYLPPVPCSTPARIHPDYHPVREACDAWLLAALKPQNEGYKQFLIQSMHPLFVCVTIPDALSRNVLPLCKMIAWLFVVDNFCDELMLMAGDLMAEKEYYDYILCLLEGTPFSSDKDWGNELKEMSDVLLDVWNGIRAHMSPRQQKRFINILKDVFDATLAQSREREEQGVVDLNSYLALRKFTGEGYVFMIMAEYGNGLDLEDDILSNPDIVELQSLVAYHVAYVNDLLSFRKEYCLGHYQNLPAVLCVHENYSMQDAICGVCKMIQDLDEKFVSLRNKIINSDLIQRPGVRSYLDVLGYVMSGFLEWAYQTGRYHGLNNHLTLRHGMVSLVHRDLTLITQGVPGSLVNSAAAAVCQ